MTNYPNAVGYIPGMDLAGEARGRNAVEAWQDAISGRAPNNEDLAGSTGRNALSQWQRQCELQSSLPIPPAIDRA